MSGLSASAEQAREAARRGDGKFGAYAADESAAELPMSMADTDLRALGSQVASRAEEIAGISAEQIRQNWSDRLADARKAESLADPAPMAPKAEDLSDEDKVWVLQRHMAIRNGEDLEESGFGRKDAPEAVIGVEFDRPASSRWREASEQLERVESGTDEETQRELKLLTDGYLRALSEHRGDVQTFDGETASDLSTLFTGGQGGMIGIGRADPQFDRRDVALGAAASADRSTP